MLHSSTKSHVRGLSLGLHRGGITELGQDSKSKVFIAHVSIDFENLNLPSSKLAHEFGHALTFSRDPYNATQKMGPLHNCQKSSNRNSYQSKDAMDWQRTYTKNRKMFPNGTPSILLMKF